MVLLFSVFLIGFSGGMRHVEGQMLTTLKVAGVLAGGGAVVALALIVMVSAAPTRMAKFVSCVGRLLPHRIAEAVLGMVMAFTTGFEVARQPVRLLRIFLWSIPMWLGVAAGACRISRLTPSVLSCTQNSTFSALAASTTELSTKRGCLAL